MAFLPSYQEATARPDWLKLVAPYCEFDDYRPLCLVCRRFRDVFAPLLWTDLFHAARLGGLEPGDGECVNHDELYPRGHNIRFVPSTAMNLCTDCNLLWL